MSRPDREKTAPAGTVGNVTEANTNRSLEVRLHVPGLQGRQLVRLVTARLRDLPGVDLVQADGPTGILVVQGTVTEQGLREALAALGLPSL